MNYENGKIYVIRNYCNDLVYIGSTTQSLSKRFSWHKASMKYKKIQLYEAFEKLGIYNFYIELLELCPCSCKEELCKKEGYYIRKFDSYKNGYNMRIEGRTRKEYGKEYREVNKEKIKEQTKQYYEKNKEKIKEYRKDTKENKKKYDKERRKLKYQCECGSIVSLADKSKHFLTKKHLKYIENL